MYATKEFIKLNRAIEAGELVYVVRCKDCRDYKPNPYSEGNEKLCMCWADWIPTEPDDFCSYGERDDDA